MAVVVPLAALVLVFRVPLLSLLEAGGAFGWMMGVRHRVLSARFAVMVSQQMGRAVALIL